MHVPHHALHARNMRLAAMAAKRGGSCQATGCSQVKGVVTTPPAHQQQAGWLRPVDDA